MRTLEIGDVITGTVTGIEKYGIFVNVEKYSGLIHISEISNNFVRNVNDYGKVGQKIKVKIVGVNKEKRQLKLSIKEFEVHSKNSKRQKIIETASGFSTMAKYLDSWISGKILEMNSKK